VEAEVLPVLAQIHRLRPQLLLFEIKNVIPCPLVVSGLRPPVFFYQNAHPVCHCSWAMWGTGIRGVVSCNVITGFSVTAAGIAGTLLSGQTCRLDLAAE